MYIVIGKNVSNLTTADALYAAFTDYSNLHESWSVPIQPDFLREDEVYFINTANDSLMQSEVDSVATAFRNSSERIAGNGGVFLLFTDVMSDDYDRFYFELTTAHDLNMKLLERFEELSVKTGFFLLSEQAEKFHNMPYRTANLLRRRVEGFDILFTLSSTATRLLHTEYDTAATRIVEVSPRILSALTHDQAFDIDLRPTHEGDDLTATISRDGDKRNNVPKPDSSILRVGYAGQIAGNEEGFDKFLSLVMGLEEGLDDPLMRPFNPNYLRIQPVVFISKEDAEIFTEEYINTRLLGGKESLQGVLPVEYHLEERMDVLMYRSLTIMVDCNFDTSASPASMQSIALGVPVMSIVEHQDANKRDPFGFNAVPEYLPAVQILKIEQFLRARLSTKGSDSEARKEFAYRFINQLIAMLQEIHDAGVEYNTAHAKFRKANKDTAGANVVQLFDEEKYSEALHRLRNQWDDSNAQSHIEDLSLALPDNYAFTEKMARQEIHRVILQLDNYLSINRR